MGLLHKILRLTKLVTFPVKYVFAGLYPNFYARLIGVRAKGRFKVYGNSYYTFGAEPYLVTLGDNVLISREVNFICHDGASLIAKQQYPEMDVVKPIQIGDNVFIGLGVTILPGVTVGNDVIIAARSVVTKNIEDGIIIAGSPARKIGKTEDKIKKSLENSTGLGNLKRSQKEKIYRKKFNV